MEDSYKQEFNARVVSCEGTRVVLDETAFYPTSGGQPNDTGVIIGKDGILYLITDVKKEDGKIVHITDKIGLMEGDHVKGKVNWERRYRLMRMHTAAHIIDAILYNETGALCTGNQLGIEKSRIDFSLDALDKDKMQHYIDMANKWVQKAVDVKIYSMPREKALKIPGIVKLATAMPPEIKELRIVEIPGIDMQADGGTQVKNTREIGKISLVSVENKGKNNRRLYFTLD